MTGPSLTVEHAPATRRLVLPVILLAQFVIPLSIAGTAVGLPVISAELGTDPVLLQGVVNGFNIAFALCTVLWGPVADRIGSARAFSWGVLLVVIGSVASGVSPNLVVLDLARALAGVGAAAVITGATATISRSYEGPARARAFAAFGTINGLGLAAGPSISGVLIGFLGWRAVFLAHAVVLLIALFGSFVLPRRPVAKSGGGPMLDLGLLRNPGFLSMTLIPVAGAVGFVTLLTYLPAALQAVHDFSAAEAGTMMLFMTLPVLLAPTAVHRVTQHRLRVGAAAISLLALACLLIAPLGLLLLRPELPPALIAIPMVFAGLGFGLPLGIVDGRALSFVPPEQSGTAAGLLNFFRIGSEAVFVALYSAALTASIRAQPDVAGEAERIAAGQSGHAGAYAAALQPVLVGVAVVVLLLGAVFPRLYRRATAGRRRTVDQPASGLE
ncbi:MFS transporter [Arthrobacter sp. NPDC090010]|uniref:MFS transporter n=1 Tax=Arthrobacter sp. NPDC090010 TaxID=3363942 RepID=UPI0038076298